MRQAIEIAYGHESHTTAIHLERAVAAAGLVADTPGGPLLWVETGKPWLPSVEAMAGRTTAAWIIDTHRGIGWRRRVAQAFDLVFVAQQDAVAPLQAAGVPTRWLPLAAPADLVPDAPPLADRPYDVAFVGQAPTGSLRAVVLEALAVRHRVTPQDGFVAPPQMMERYASAKVVLNMPLATDLNMRVFEATAAGALLVTGPAIGQEDLLPAGSYVEVADRSVDAWVEAVGRALADPMAAFRAGEARTTVLDRHTYRHRAETVVEALSEPSVRRPISNEARRRALAAGYSRWGKAGTAARLPESGPARVRAAVEGVGWRTATEAKRAQERLRRLGPGLARSR